MASGRNIKHRAQARAGGSFLALIKFDRREELSTGPGFNAGLRFLTKLPGARVAKAGGLPASMSDVLKPGDIVQLTMEAAQKSKFPNRRGTVVRIGKPPSQVSVLWSALGTPQVVHSSFLRRVATMPNDEEPIR